MFFIWSGSPLSNGAIQRGAHSQFQKVPWAPRVCKPLNRIEWAFYMREQTIASIGIHARILTCQECMHFQMARGKARLALYWSTVSVNCTKVLNSSPRCGELVSAQTNRGRYFGKNILDSEFLQTTQKFQSCDMWIISNLFILRLFFSNF